jgi:hypothetical protein
MRRPWSPVQVKQWSEHDSKKFKEQTVKEKNFKDRTWTENAKACATRSPIQTAEKLVPRAHMKMRKSSRRHEKRQWRRRVRDGPGGPRSTGLGRSPIPFLGPFTAPFDLDDPRTIYSPPAKSQTSIHAPFVIEEQWWEGHHSRVERVELVV